MHELGVVFRIIDDLTEVGKENKLEKIHSVTIQLLYYRRISASDPFMGIDL